MALSIGPLLLASALAVPLALLAACLLRTPRRHALAVLPLAPIPALAAALVAAGGGSLTFAQPALRLTLFLDAPGAMLLGVVALLWLGAGAYAFADRRGKPNAERFAVAWLLTLIGSVGVFIAADLLSFYLVYALVSIPAYWLVVQDGNQGDASSVRRAGGLYMAFALLGEAFLLMGFALLAAGHAGGSLQIRDVVAALPQSPWRDAALAMTVLGFGLKIALVPMHGWMPLTYTTAPIPAAAVLSGAAVKAGVIGLIRFLPFGATLPGWGEALAALGMLSAFYGVAVGMTQQHPKTVLAYSSISQMGVIAAALGMGLATGDQGAALAVAFYAANHALVKGALFLAIGVATLTSERRLWLLVGAPALLLALSLGGLPLTGGALAKIAVKGALGSGVIGTLATLSAAGTTLLMLHFLQCLTASASQNPQARAPADLVVPWLALALASVLVPWLVFPLAGGDVVYALSPSALWESFWPLLLGAALALVLRRWGSRLPQVPAGDIVVAGEAAFRAGAGIGVVMERADAALRQWPTAAVSLLTVAILLGAAMLSRF
jgi:formate hydrogenlyase subunit 3/multisubunit Na+/H+ antiporter MnhD subunit